MGRDHLFGGLLRALGDFLEVGREFGIVIAAGDGDLAALHDRFAFRRGDVLVAISGSGNSENVLRAARHARELGCEVIGLIGFSGGALRDLCSIPIIVSASTIEEAEDGHLIVNHAFCTAIKALDASGIDPQTA